VKSDCIHNDIFLHEKIVINEEEQCDIPQNKIFFEDLNCWKFIPFLENSNLENFCHLWQFRILNLLFVINYYDCWAEL
jgi:hypothetical protein